MQCFFPQYALKYISTPYFILNSAYDVFQVIFFDIFCFNILYCTTFSNYEMIPTYNVNSSIIYWCHPLPICTDTGTGANWTRVRVQQTKLIYCKVPISIFFLSSLWNSVYWEVSSVYSTKMFVFANDYIRTCWKLFHHDVNKTDFL